MNEAPSNKPSDRAIIFFVRPLLVLVAFIVILFVVRTILGESNKYKEAGPKIVESDLVFGDRSFVCRAAIAELMGRPIDIISAAEHEVGTIRTSYVRPSDGTNWSFSCVLEGNRVIWASVENGARARGRWRTDEADEIVTFLLDSDRVTITQLFSDGSLISENYLKE